MESSGLLRSEKDNMQKSTYSVDTVVGTVEHSDMTQQSVAKK